jgi:hypothetical protein
MTKPLRSHTVYVVGAGFSAGLEYPLVNDLLIRLWGRIHTEEQHRLRKVIEFHHPGFNPERRTTFPTIELLLSEMMANEQLFDASRSAPGNFTKEDLQEIRQRLLLAVATWFHEIHQETFKALPPWLATFRDVVIKPNDTIISFNWDLILDQLIFEDTLNPACYGFGNRKMEHPMLLKPHGSLNWYDEKQGGRLKKDLRFELFNDVGGQSVQAFRPYRAPKSKEDYMPLIIPPVFNKDFEGPFFRRIWQKCVAQLSTTRKVVFLGYSLPDADLHARFILRCGFHNQIEGQIRSGGGRSVPTGRAEVIIVNPDQGAASRIERAVGSDFSSYWQPSPVSRWVDDAAAA